MAEKGMWGLMKGVAMMKGGGKGRPETSSGGRGRCCFVDLTAVHFSTLY